MLDFFSIFSKGGILLWCFKGAGLLQKEWEAFTPTVNELIKSVLLQERAVKKSYWEHGQLALKYKMVRTALCFGSLIRFETIHRIMSLSWCL